MDDKNEVKRINKALLIAISALFRIEQEGQDDEPPSIKEISTFAGEALREISEVLR